MSDKLLIEHHVEFHVTVSVLWRSSRVNQRHYSRSSECRRSSPVKQSTNHSHRYKTYRFPAILSLHWRTRTNQLWSDHRFSLVCLVKLDMRTAYNQREFYRSMVRLKGLDYSWLTRKLHHSVFSLAKLHPL